MKIGDTKSFNFGTMPKAYPRQSRNGDIAPITLKVPRIGTDAQQRQENDALIRTMKKG